MRIHFKSTSYAVALGVFSVVFLCVIYVSLWRWNDFKEFHRSILKTPRKGQRSKFSVAELMGSTNVLEVVLPYRKTVISQPPSPFLKGHYENRRPFAVILVTSMAKYFNQRRSIRLTWYKWAESLNIRVFFMIGFHDFSQQDLLHVLEDEQRIYNDLIIDEYEEGYYKLPGKVLRMLKWYNATYSEKNAPRFFVKTDQDVFINLPNLVSALQNTSYYKNLVALSNLQNSTVLLPDSVNLPFDSADPETYFVGGKRFENAKVDEDPDSKWYIDSGERERFSWPANLYPTYTNGPCYIFSGNIVSSIYETSLSVPIYPFEDVYIVGMIAYDRLNLYISQMNDMWLAPNYLELIKNRRKMQEIIAIHTAHHPAIMLKICKRVSTCKKILDIASSSCREKASSVKLVVFSLALTVLHSATSKGTLSYGFY